jgi:hypothetical protein
MFLSCEPLMVQVHMMFIASFKSKSIEPYWSYLVKVLMLLITFTKMYMQVILISKKKCVERECFGYKKKINSE